MIRLARVEFGCTLGLTVSGYAFTAGHCGSPRWRGNEAYAGYAEPDPIGTTVFLSQLPALDYAVIRLAPGVRWREVSVAAGPPRVGQRLCKLGRASGWTCGPIRRVLPTQIIAELPGAIGDSGSLGVTSAGGVGLLRGLDPSSGPFPFWRPGDLVVFTRLDAILSDAHRRGLL